MQAHLRGAADFLMAAKGWSLRGAGGGASSDAFEGSLTFLSTLQRLPVEVTSCSDPLQRECRVKIERDG